MKILKFISAFIFVGLFFVACSDDKGRTYNPLFEAKFDSPKNNVYYNSGMKIPVIMTFDSTKIAAYKVFINDSLVADKKFDRKTDRFTIATRKLKFGAYKLRLEASLKDGTVVKDNRNIRLLTNKEPEKFEAKVVGSLPHNTTSYTQGLEFYKGELYEGTGQKGSSKLLKVKKEDGTFLKEHALSNEFFGEGITILNDKVYQLTWQKKTCFVYDVKDFTEIKRFSYLTEGWGLCNNGEQIIMSDGSHRIYFRNPETFEVEREIEVFTNQNPVGKLNELEYIDGKIYANIYTTNRIVVIDPATGNVEKV